MQFFIQVAGITVKIDAVSDLLLSMSDGYIVDECVPDITVSTKESEIHMEKGSANNTSPEYLKEFLAIHRKIAESMPDFGVFLMHGAVIAVNGKSYLFTAPSGTGKSTHIRKWIENLPDAYVVNGDKPLIKTGAQPTACGTPWAGKEGWQRNECVPLEAIVLMERSEDNEIKQISFSEAFAGLLRQTYQPGNTAKFIKTLRLLKTLDHKVRFYSFKFNNLKEDAFSVAYHELSGNTVQ